jgi:hypothetical protein
VRWRWHDKSDVVMSQERWSRVVRKREGHVSEDSTLRRTSTSPRLHVSTSQTSFSSDLRKPPRNCSKRPPGQPKSSPLVLPQSARPHTGPSQRGPGQWGGIFKRSESGVRDARSRNPGWSAGDLKPPGCDAERGGSYTPGRGRGRGRRRRPSLRPDLGENDVWDRKGERERGWTTIGERRAMPDEGEARMQMKWGDKIKAHQRARDHMDAPGLARLRPPCIPSSHAAQSRSSPQSVSTRHSTRSARSLTVLLHHTEGLDDDLGGGADEHLALSTALGVDDVVLRSQREVLDVAAVLRHLTPATCVRHEDRYPPTCLPSSDIHADIHSAPGLPQPRDNRLFHSNSVATSPAPPPLPTRSWPTASPPPVSLPASPSSKKRGTRYTAHHSRGSR